MENALLIGLSRQVTLERQLDVVANNVANVNTNGFKADKSLFQEYLMPGAHEDNFVGRDRRLSYVQDRATFHDFAQGPTEQTKNPLDVAIDGKSDIQEIQVFGDWAYLRNYIEMTVTPPAGNPVRRSGYTLTILRKEADGRWRLTRDANLLTLAS